MHWASLANGDGSGHWLQACTVQSQWGSHCLCLCVIPLVLSITRHECWLFFFLFIALPVYFWNLFPFLLCPSLVVTLSAPYPFSFCPHVLELSLYTHPYTLIPILIGFLFDFQDTKVLLMQQYWPFTVVLWFLCSRKFSSCAPHILSFSNFPQSGISDFLLGMTSWGMLLVEKHPPQVCSVHVCATTCLFLDPLF